jgi:hypothetical protein
MKKIYVKPETVKVPTIMESLMNTDSTGLDDQFVAKKNTDMEFDDEIGDLWGTDTGNMDLRGDGE